MITWLVVIALVLCWFGLSPRMCPRLWYRFLFLTGKELGDASELAALAGQYGGKEHWFYSDKGHMLHGWSFGDLRTGTQPILYGIGRDGDIARRVQILRLLITAGCQVFIYEPSGYGKSGGKPSLPQLCRDARNAFDYVCRKFRRQQNDIVLFGESFGGAIFVWLLGRREPAGLILKSSFASFVKVAKEMCLVLHLYPRIIFPKPRLDTAGELRRTKVPVLIVHGRRDRIAGWHHAKRLQAAARAPVVVLENSRHSFIKPEDERSFVEGVGNFLAARNANRAASV